MSTIGDDIRARQFTSVQRNVMVLTITTEWSLVDRKISGCRDSVRVRGRTAMAQNWHELLAAYIAVGMKVIMAKFEGILSLAS